MVESKIAQMMQEPMMINDFEASMQTQEYMDNSLKESQISYGRRRGLPIE